ncbi:MAG: hypothetical protein KC621_19080 [Myxococcales bacterium]|nr:hypothetical protein [Myxococcales bacterium]
MPDQQQRRPANIGLMDHMPTNADGPSALYAYGNSGYTGNPYIDAAFGPSTEAGFGMFRGGGRDPNTGLTGAADIMYGDFYNGRRSDGTIGMGARAGMFNGSAGYENHGVLANANMGLLTAEADAHVGPNDAGFAVGADIISGGIEVGTRNANSSTDSTVGISGSIGSPGASAHLLYGDADGDGYREYGFDMSGMFGLGFGIKMTTEDPLRTAMGPIGSLVPQNINLTEQAGNAAVTAGNAIADGASWAGEQIGNGASWAGDQISSGASWAGDKLSSAGSAISSGWNSLWD